MVHGVRLLRNESKLTQSALSEKSGVSRATIARIEGPKAYSPSVDTLKKLAEALGCTIDELVKNA